MTKAWVLVHRRGALLFNTERKALDHAREHLIPKDAQQHHMLLPNRLAIYWYPPMQQPQRLSIYEVDTAIG